MSFDAIAGLEKHRHFTQNLVSLPRSYNQASFWPHLWLFKQAGHCSRNLRLDSELSLIFSVVRPVATILPKFGHRIKISGIPSTLSGDGGRHASPNPVDETCDFRTNS